MKRKLAAILSSDAVGYSRLMGEDEPGTLATLKSHLQSIGSLVEKHQGRVAAIHGDNLLAEFGSVVDAVRCAMEIQKEIKARNEELPEASRMPFRIGINLGDVIEDGGNVYGDGVNVAARLEGLAAPGGICISRSVHDQVKKIPGVGYQSLGAHVVKNIAEAVHVYRVLPEPDAFGNSAGKVWSRLKRWQKVSFAVAIVLLPGVAGIAVKKYMDRPASSPGMFAFFGQEALPLPEKPSIAVLPFENMTGDPKQEFFTDGFTEQIITSLSKIPSLFVISRNSTFTYKGKPVKARKVGKELGVRYLLEGSIQKSGDRVRINAQLIDAISERHVWAESYDRDLKDIFSLQDDVILKILTALQVNLTSGEQARVWAKGTKRLEAYLKLMQCRQYLFQMNKESNVQARRLAEETIALDPGYADAYAMLGATHQMDVYLGASLPEDAIAKAIEWTQKALAMNGSLADARSRLGVLYSWSGRYDEGIAEAERGVELDPNSALANFNWRGSPVRRKIEGGHPGDPEGIAPGTVCSGHLRSKSGIGLFPDGRLQGSHRGVREGTQASAGQSEFPRHYGRCLWLLRQGKGGRERGNRSPQDQSEIHRGVLHGEPPLQESVRQGPYRPGAAQGGTAVGISLTGAG